MTTLHELLAGLIRPALTNEALADGLKARIGEMKGRLERLQARAARKRDLAHEAMTQAGIYKFTAPDFSAAMRQGSPSLEIDPDAEVPAAYSRPQDPKLDKLMLLAAVKNGLMIAGVTLAPRRTQLSVRNYGRPRREP